MKSIDIVLAGTVTPTSGTEPLNIWPQQEQLSPFFLGGGCLGGVLCLGVCLGSSFLSGFGLGNGATPL